MKSAHEMIASTRNTARAPVPRRHFRRSREKRFKQPEPSAPSFATLMPFIEPAPDPVRLAVLAMESLARASMRASFSGTAIEVSVPDARTAAIFEAVLAETAQRRSTDRLIRIVIDQPL